MAVSLKGQAAIVLGASSGIGRACAAALAAEGAKVMASARREDRLTQLKKEASGTVEVCACDATDRAQVARLVSTTKEKFGRIDLVVYATGENLPDRAIEVLPPEKWDMMIGVNLTGAFNVTKALLPIYRQQNGGLIIYISSISAHVPDVSGVAYQASKRGLEGLAHGTRVEERKNGIRTCVIYPGLVKTDILKKRPKPTPQEHLDVALEPEDIADGVVAVAKLHPRAVVPEMELVPARL